MIDQAIPCSFGPAPDLTIVVTSPRVRSKEIPRIIDSPELDIQMIKLLITSFSSITFSLTVLQQSQLKSSDAFENFKDKMIK